MDERYLSKPISQLKELGYRLLVTKITHENDVDEEWWVFRNKHDGSTIEFDIKNRKVAFNGSFDRQEMDILMGVIELWQLL